MANYNAGQKYSSTGLRAMLVAALMVALLVHMIDQPSMITGVNGQDETYCSCSAATPTLCSCPIIAGSPQCVTPVQDPSLNASSPQYCAIFNSAGVTPVCYCPSACAFCSTT